ncbi:MAG TPA: hypothetical protein VII82_04550 [Polyangiaceae bacterium]
MPLDALRIALVGSASAVAVACLTAVASTSCGSAGAIDAGPGATPDDAGDPFGAHSCGDASASVPPLIDAAECAAGHLVAAAPVTIVTPDPDPENTVLAASPSGNLFLAAWTDGGVTINATRYPETIWASLVQPAGGAVAISAAIELSGNGVCPVAAWNGTDFTVVWGDDSGLRSQRIDASGSPVGAPAQVLSKANANACPASLVAANGGLALAWYDWQSNPAENVGLIGQSGAIGSRVLLDMLGPGVAPNAALAQLKGRTYVAFVEWPDANTVNTVVSEIDWSKPAVLSQTVEPGFGNSFLAAGDELWLTTFDAVPALYAGTPGSPFRAVGTSCNSVAIAADACGRLVQLGTQGNTPAGVSLGFFAQPLGWPSPAVQLGNVTGSAIAGAASTYGLLWYARVGPGIPDDPEASTSGSLSFTTLSWRSP